MNRREDQAFERNRSKNEKPNKEKKKHKQRKTKKQEYLFNELKSLNNKVLEQENSKNDNEDQLSTLLKLLDEQEKLIKKISYTLMRQKKIKPKQGKRS